MIIFILILLTMIIVYAIISSFNDMENNKNEVFFVTAGSWNPAYHGYPYHFIFNRNYPTKEVSIPQYLEYRNLNNITIENYLFNFYDLEKELQNLSSICRYYYVGENYNNKQCIMCKENNLINIISSDMNTKKVFKSQKESILKNQLNDLHSKLNQFKSDFDLSGDYSHRFYKSSYWKIKVLEPIKPGIVLGYVDFNEILYRFNQYINEKYYAYENYIRHRIDEIKNQYEGEMYGRIGEEKVMDTTNEFDNCIALHNIQLPTTNSKQESFITEIDTILITTRGIFILEVKNYGKVGSYEIKIDSTGQWMIKNGSKEVPRENPNKQNNMHVISFNKFINSKLENKNIDAIGVIVIGNDDVKISQESPMKNLKRVDELYNYIKEFEPNKYTLDEIREIARVINENKVVIDKKYKINCLYEEVLANLEIMREDMTKMINLPHTKNSLEEFLKNNQEKYNYSFVEKLSTDSKNYKSYNRYADEIYDFSVSGISFPVDILDTNKLDYDCIS